jgi:hypothetical protein
MIVRADHVAAIAFVALGLLVFSLSGDLPVGTLSFPGSGFLPKLVTMLMMAFGVLLFVGGSASPMLTSLDWSDLKHAATVVGITAITTLVYTRLGFIVSLVLLMIGVLVVAERKNPLRATLYALTSVLVTYAVFEYALKIPLPTGPLGF